MQNVSQSEQKHFRFSKFQGEINFHVIAIFTNLQRALSAWKFKIILLETFKCWANTVRKITFKIFIQFILHLTQCQVSPIRLLSLRLIT